MNKKEINDLIQRAGKGDKQAKQDLQKEIENMPEDGKRESDSARQARENAEKAMKTVKDMRNNAGKNAEWKGKGK